MRSVHLRVMKLKRHRELRPEQPSLVAAPYHERIIEHSAIHTDRSVYIIIHESRSAYDHAFSQVMVFTALGHLPRETVIVG